MSDSNGYADASGQPQQNAMPASCGHTFPSDEVSNRQNLQSVATILDSLDALVYVADMATHEILFFNAYGRSIWGNSEGKICWQVLQAGQNGPCEFCTNHRLLDDHGEPTGAYGWEFQNTVNKRWYQCRDQAIRWIDGRLVRMEIATDITDRKQAEELLKVAKERAEFLARTDELTGLNNRRAFLEDGQKLFNQAKRFGHPASLIMLDADHFKGLNDNYGHAMGDVVLQAIAKILREHTREVDVIGRIGGEEFAVILPETPLANAASLAERLREKISLAKLDHPKGEIRFTASFGVSTCNQDASSLESLLKQADAALYQAKENGRDRTEIAKQP
jgi:diguanylate cyclase (GGDEF)-like protein